MTLYPSVYKPFRKVLTDDTLWTRRQTWSWPQAIAAGPSLMQGSYRTQELDALLGDTDYAWGGAAAAYRQTQHYRGTTTVIHGDLGSALNEIQARPARQSPNLLVLGHIGEIRGTTPHLAHPLLVYSELYQDPNERAREAAQVYYDKFLGKIGE